MSFDVWQALLSETENLMMEMYHLPEEEIPPDVMEISEAA